MVTSCMYVGPTCIYNTGICMHHSPQWRRPGAEFGGRSNFSRTKISEWRFFRKNFHFHAQNFGWPFFSHRPGFSDFPFLFPDCPYLYYIKWLNVVYDPFHTRKTTIFRKEFRYDTFFTLFVLSRASDKTTSQNIGGTDSWAVPHLKFWGGPSPSPLRSLPLKVPGKVDYNKNISLIVWEDRLIIALLTA